MFSPKLKPTLGENHPLLSRQPTFQSLRRNSFFVSDSAGNVSQERPKLSPKSTDYRSCSVFSESTFSLLADHHHPSWREWTSIKLKSALALVSSKEMKYVFKCSLAYLLASMMVYSPLSKLYGVIENKHMAATVAVYFHPARTAGSMGESFTFVFLALSFSGLMAILSMLVSKAFLYWDLKIVGYAIDLFVFCAFGLGSIAFFKQRVNKPTFNTACSVASIFFVTTMVREGNVQAGVVSLSRLGLVFGIVSSGVLSSALVCYALWPESAVSEVKKALNKSMQINSEILLLLTEKFIECESVHGTRYMQLKSEFNTCFKRIHKHLSDARYELYFQGKERELDTLKDLTNSSHKMSLHLNGLGSSAFTQWSLFESDLKAAQRGGTGPHSLKNYGSISSMYSQLENSPVHSALKHYNSIRGFHAAIGIAQPDSSISLFKEFIASLEPPMKTYISTLKVILDGIPIENTNLGFVPSMSKYLQETVEAVDTYSTAREKALADLYQQQNFRKNRDFHLAANEEGAAASCGNFSYLLEEFGNELVTFLSILDQYNEISHDVSSPRSYNWLKFWEKQSPLNKVKTSSISNILTKTLKCTPRSSAQVTWSLRIWRSLHAFRRPDIQFGIKVGLGAAVFAIPAFTDRFRLLFGAWRGEWGLITYVIIMNKSVGGTANSVPIRILGTFLGAFIAYITWTLFPENKYILPLCGFVLSLPCFWMILIWKSQNMFGQFILLTFNITVLYTYTLSKSDKSDPSEHDGQVHLIVKDIAFHRFLSVCVGVVLALLVTTLVLPNSARSKLKRGLSILWLQMGLVWKNDVLGTLPRKGTSEYKIAGIEGENLMQLVMIELCDFSKHAPKEIRLKGPFASKEYGRLLKSTQHILDAFQDISVLVAKDSKATSGELNIIEYTSAERRELCNRIFLNFYLLSSAMRLGFPLPDKMPFTEHAIDRMLVKLNEYRLSTLSKCSDVDAKDNGPVNSGYEDDFVLFYTYILVTINITEELAKMALYIQNLFGIIEDDMFQV